MNNNVTAILTTYQRSRLAKRALTSIFSQSFSPAEIIVVEDAGETDLADWIAALGRDDLKYVRHDRNRGLAAARNTGLRLANSDLIAYIDDDDLWLPTRLQEQVERYRSLHCDQKVKLASLQVGCIIVDSQGQPIGEVLPVNQGNLRESIIKVGPATPSSSFMFVRSKLLEIGGFDEGLISGIDHDVWMKLAVAGYSNEVIKKPLVMVTRNDRPKMMSDTERRILGLTQYVKKWTPTYREWFGEIEGDIYARRYFIRIVCGLAGQKFADRQFSEGILATKAALRTASGSPALLFYGIRLLLRTYASSALPQLAVAKRAIIRRPEC